MIPGKFWILGVLVGFVVTAAAVAAIAILAVKLDDARGELDRFNQVLFHHYLITIALSSNSNNGKVSLKLLVEPAEFYMLGGEANESRPMPLGWYPTSDGRAVLGPGQNYGAIRVRTPIAVPDPFRLVEVVVPKGVLYNLTVREVAY